MRIGELVKRLRPKSVVFSGLENEEAASVCCDARKAEKRCVFFAYAGERYDSHKDAAGLYEKGAASFIVCERDLGPNIPHAVVENGRAALSEAASAFYGDPLSEYLSAAVTGTNGKTTTTYLIESMCRASGAETVRIGTTGARAGKINYVLDNTTPSPLDFFRILKDGLREGCRYLAAEISSHALAQGRVAGAGFRSAVFTNLTGDHLDFHKTMKDYFEAKALLFRDETSENKIINAGNEYGRELASRINNGLITYSVSGNADVYPVKYSFDINGTEADVMAFGKKIGLRSNLIGSYNLENLLASAAAALSLGLSEENVEAGAENLENVPGRLARAASGDFSVFVDYAHTDDALKNVLLTLRSLKPSRLITVFGAGGDRDSSKRPRMGRVASELSDVTFVTSDNPRTEDPKKIISDILSGTVPEAEIAVEPDREKAIAAAVEKARPGDVVLIAGKGHENYQIIGTEKRSFDDAEIVRKYAGRV